MRTIRNNQSEDTQWNHVLVVAKIFLIMGRLTFTFIYIMMYIYFHIHPPNGATFLFFFLLQNIYNLDIKYILDLQTDTSRSCLDVRAYFSSSGSFLPAPPSRKSGSRGILQKCWFGQIVRQVRIVLDILNLFTGVIIFGVLVCKVCLAWINRWLMFRSWC